MLHMGGLTETRNLENLFTKCAQGCFGRCEEILKKNLQLVASRIHFGSHRRSVRKVNI